MGVKKGSIFLTEAWVSRSHGAEQSTNREETDGDAVVEMLLASKIHKRCRKKK